MNPATLEAPPARYEHKELLGDDGLWARVTARIRKDHEFQSRFGEMDESDQINWSECIFNETIGFLKFCSLGVGSFGPSPLVDIGWHTFMLYSRDYTDFCEDLCGTYIHHEPTDDPTMVHESHEPDATPNAMIANGIAVNNELWEGLDHSRCGPTDPSATRCQGSCRNGCKSSCRG